MTTSLRASRRHEVALQWSTHGQDRDVERFVHRFHRARRGDLQRDLRMGRTKARQMLGELMHRDRGRAQDAHVAARLGRRFAGQRLGFLDLDQDRPHLLEIGLADLGQRDAARGAVEQPCAEVRLELGHHARDHRRRRVQRPRRPGKSTLVDDLREDFHRTQLVHHSSFIGNSAF